MRTMDITIKDRFDKRPLGKRIRPLSQSTFSAIRSFSRAYASRTVALARRISRNRSFWSHPVAGKI